MVVLTSFGEFGGETQEPFYKQQRPFNLAFLRTTYDSNVFMIKCEESLFTDIFKFSSHLAMAEAIQNLIASRDLLKSSLEQSREIEFAIEKTTTRIYDINQRLPFLEADIRNIARKCAVFGIKDHINCAIAPVSAVSRVYESVNELGSLLSAHSCSDLKPYLSILKQFQESLGLLTSSCKLANGWLEDVKQFLENKTVAADDWYHWSVKKCLRTLEELQRTEERSCLNGGILDTAFGELEDEFRNLLIDKSSPLPVPSSLLSSGDEESDVHDPSAAALPLPVVRNLQAIVECLARNNRVSKCMSIYVNVRSMIAQRTLQGLDLDYLQVSLSEFDSVQGVEGYIDEWGRHLEFLVKHLLEQDYNLCKQVFGQSVEPDTWTDCFAKVAAESGIQGFIKFGNMVTKGKKEAIKLFKLLDVFAALNNLRMDFNKVFSGKPCSEIQTQTRDLIKKVVNGAYEIFWELSAQVELQRLTDPPPDGKIPRLVSFVVEYSNELLDDDYRTVLEQVLEIHWSWNSTKKFTKGLVSVEIHNIVKSLELNLETWAKRYEDAALSYLFMMNSSCYLSKNLKGTKLGDLMGESWIKVHDDRMEYYAALYLQESWGKIPTLLSEDISLVSGGQVIVRDMVKKKIKGFNEAFDDMYRKQSSWVVCDRGLRWKTCQLVLEAIIPPYRSYMQKYLALVEGGTSVSPNKYVKYSAESLESMLTSMFQPKLGKYGSSAKCTHLMGKIKNVVANHFSSTAAA